MDTSQSDPIKRMCRTCMIQDQNFRSIFDYTDAPLKIFEMLSTTAPQLLILNSDELPQQICMACFNKLNIAYGFQQMCVNSEKHLRQMLAGALITVPLPCEAKDGICLEKDPLLAEEHIKMEDFVTNEEHGKEVQGFHIERRIESPELNPTDVASREEDRQQEVFRYDSDAGWSGSDASGKDEATSPTRTRSQTARAKMEEQTRTSSMHNETGVDEIEKPNLRNRRKGNIPCPHCNKLFDRPYRLKRHAGVHSQAREFQCDICKYRFSTVNQLARHKLSHDESVRIKRIPPPEGYKCAECPRRFEKRESLSAHIQSHRKADPSRSTFKCDICSKEFSKFTSLIKHTRTHPENQQFKCTQCEKTFPMKAHLIEHMNKHNSLKQYLCIYCNKAFQQSGTLKEHQRIHTGEKPFLCSQCGKSFKNASNMRQHLLRHSGERRYQCPECPSKFACHSDQIKHMSTHRAVKPHVCDICGSSFTRSYTLTKHKYIHTGERPHKCEECNMTFVFIDHMRRHMRTHTGEKPYKCKFCDRAFAESGDLNKHLRSHVGEKTYICDQCPESFKYQQELREHQRQHFKEQQAALEVVEPKTEI